MFIGGKICERWREEKVWAEKVTELQCGRKGKEGVGQGKHQAENISPGLMESCGPKISPRGIPGLPNKWSPSITAKFAHWLEGDCSGRVWPQLKSQGDPEGTCSQSCELTTPPKPGSFLKGDLRGTPP